MGVQKAEKTIEAIHERIKVLNNSTDWLIKLEKKFIGKQQKLRKLKEPIAIVLRESRNITIHENVKGSEWRVPPEPGVSDTEEEKKKIVYLNKQCLYDLPWAGKTAKIYIINENDAMPVGANVKVWSEGIQHVITAILINYQNLLDKLAGYKSKAMGDFIMKVMFGIAALVGLYILYKLIVPAPEPTPETIVQTVKLINDSAIYGG